MKNLLRAILAGIGAKKIGGGKCGCIGTVVVSLFYIGCSAMFLRSFKGPALLPFRFLPIIM